MAINKSPICYLLDEYSDALLSEQFQQRARSRELARLFPFSIQNIYRIFMGIAIPFYEGFALLREQLDLGEPEVQELLGAPNRVFRYFHVALFGASRSDTVTFARRISVLRSLAEPIVQRIAMQLSVPESDIVHAEYCFDQVAANQRLVITLAVYLREFIDYVFMGHHAHGFVGYPPVRTSQGILVLRKFRNLSIPAIPWNAIHIYTLYAPEIYDELHYARFRGEIERLPSPTYLRFAAAVTFPERHVLTTEEVKQVLTAAEYELAAQKIRFGNMSYRHAERDLSLVFSTELLNLLEYAGHKLEPWRQRLTQGVDWSHSHFSGQDGLCLTDIYLNQLRMDVDNIRRNIESE